MLAKGTIEGPAVMIASTGVTRGREIVYTTETINLARATRETDLAFGYTAALPEDAIAGLATVTTPW